MVEIRFKPSEVGIVPDGSVNTMDKFPSGATDPETPADKETFFNTTEKKFKRYETDNWVVMDRVEALTQIADGLITNAKIDDAAGIVKSKLAALEIEDSDIKAAAAIAMSKLTLAITDTEVAAAAGIAKDKLAPLAIVNADVDAAADIIKSKLAALDIVDADVSAITVTKVTGAVDGRAATTTGDKDVTAIGYDTATEEVIIDREE
ncbi:unnamed protein product [marine sediment metagenome]|uniref:Uncharacterized protein n=1 Tax=marine sediment metagenome TaxID=412755 RepID=X0Z420_9ZZZZ